MKQTLHAVTLVVPDYDSAIAFYTQTLNFTLTQDIDLKLFEQSLNRQGSPEV
ncbi:VOC family protein [Ruegeria sp.]|uniref:VOC family protein n=1 Tax=Ruegeria sp. TaxID=1879320 RepID=UPI003B5B92CF